MRIDEPVLWHRYIDDEFEKRQRQLESSYRCFVWSMLGFAACVILGVAEKAGEVITAVVGKVLFGL